MEPPKETLTPLYQCLDLEVDVDKATLRGRTWMWLRHLPNPSPNGRFDYDSYPAEVALHCRQSKVMATKMNGALCASTYLDGLGDVVSEDGYRDAETFDICFRAKLWASAQSHSGELKIQVAPNAQKIPDLPPELPTAAPPAARAGRDEAVRLIEKSRKMEERREAKRKQGSRSGSGFPPQSPEISMMSPAHPSPASHMDSPAGGGGGGGGGTGMEDSSDDENYGVGEVKSTAVEAHRRLKREEHARVICIEVEWELIEPQSGVVFKTAREGFGGNHMYTTYSHAPIDMDGPRCWFPCVDHASVLITYDVSVRVTSPKITAAFNGRLLETTDLHDTLEEVDHDGADVDGTHDNGLSGAADSRTRCTTRYRFSTETLTAARAVGLAVGRFATWDVPQAPRVKGLGLVLRASPAGGGGRNGTLNPKHRRAADSSLSAAAGALLAHVPAAIVFLEDWLKTDYPFKRCTHVFVEGLPELFAPFGSLCLVKAELLCAQEDRIPDGDLPGDARLSVVEVLLYGWVSTAIRLEGGKHRWLVHGIAGYLLAKFAAELRGEEDKQHRLWCAVQKAVTLDCDLGCPSISPPTPDLYIPDAIDPATAYYARLKAVLILHMAEVKLQPTDMQDALSDVMRPIALHAREHKPDLSLRRQTSTFSLSRQSSSVSVSVSVSHHEANEANGDQAFARQASVASTVNSEAQRVPDVPAGEVGGHFMQPLTDMNFLLLVRTMAARGGHDLGKDLTEGFYDQWVIGQCVPYLRVGYHYKKKANVINLVMEQVVPPWMSGIACHGPLTVEVWESDSLGGGNGNGPRRFREQLPPSRDEKKTATHVETITRAVQSKSRRKRKPTTITPRNISPYPGASSSSTFGSTTTATTIATAASQGGGGGGGPATAPGASGSGGRGGGARSGLAGIEEVEEDEVDPERQAMFQAQDSNPSPVLWVKVDPQLEWIMSVRMRKPWHQWVEQLFSDESVEAQCDALRGLVELPLPFELRNSELPVQAIAEAVRGRVSHTQMEHASCVRKEAAVALALWQNHHAPPHAGGFGESIQTRTQNWKGLEHLLKAFAERFEQRDARRPSMGLGIGGSLSAANRKSALLLPNWFDDATEYRLKKALIWAAANMRARDGCTPLECLDLLVILLRENDNCENSLSDDYYVAQVLTALGQVSTTQEAGLPASSVAEAISQARLWLDLDMLGLSVSAGQSLSAVARAATRPTKSHNGVVAACALQCLCQLEMLRGGRPEVDYEAFTQYRHPTNVRIAAAQSVIQIYLAYDSGLKEEDKGEGLSAALLWVLDFVESEENAGDTRPKYWAIRCLLDALERRPLVASHLARFQTDDPLLGECDPWAGMEFFTPQGPGRAAYRPDGPLPKDFPRAAEAAERLWKLMNVGAAYDQGLRHLCFQLWRNIWGLETPPCLEKSTKDKGEGWLDRLVVGESRNVPKDKRARMRAAVDGMVDKVKGWVMGRNKRREWINRDWGEWYYRDRERQARLANKRKGEEEEEDITANPWDGRYGPEPPEETVQHQHQGLGVGVHSVQGVVQWEDGAAAGGSEAGGGGGR